MRKQIDLTTLPGWANLSDGNHTIKIKAKGTGYKESELSAGVTVSKAASTVTLEAGTYKWKDTTSLPNTNITQSFDFTSKPYNSNTDFEEVTIETSGYIRYSTKQSSLDSFYRCPNGDWVTQNAEGDEEITIELQTITLSTDQTVSSEFYKWAITDGNLVKQASKTWVLNETLSINNMPTSYSDRWIVIATFATAYNNNTNIKTKIYATDATFGSGGKAQYIQIGAEDGLLNANQFYYNKDKTEATLSSDYVYSQYSNSNKLILKNSTQGLLYRTITFETAPTGDLLTWLQANATPQS